MSDLADVLLSFPSEIVSSLTPEEYHENIHAFKTRISQYSDKQLGGSGSKGQDVLDLLDPAINTTSYIAVLNARLNLLFRSRSYDPVNIPLADPLSQRIFNLLTNFDNVQVRYSGHEWYRLVETVLTSAAKSDRSGLAVPPIQSALLGLDPTTGTFTALHTHYLRLCLATRALKHATQILQNPIHSFPSNTAKGISGPFPCSPHLSSNEYITLRSGLTSDITAQTVHEYYLLGAMVYIGLRRWSEALLFLELVLVSPNANVANGYMVEAYKKWVLVSCLLHGKMSDTPKGANPTLMRTLQSIAKPYQSIADNFVLSFDSKLRAEIEVGYKIWNEDGNLGLVQELVTRSSWFLIQGIQKTFSSITLSRIAARLAMTPDDTYVLIDGLIESGQLNATIQLPSANGSTNSSEPVLRFHSSNRAVNPASNTALVQNEAAQYAALTEQTRRTNLLAAYVKAADERLSLSKGYIDSLRKKARFKDDGGMPEHTGDGGGEMMGDGWQPTPEPVDDEDLMETN